MKFFSVWLLAVVSACAHVSASDEEWWRSGVFYQIYPRSFMDSDNSGEGDVKGIISRIQHLKDLGVTGTWLNPIFKSPMKDGGYDIADFYNIDARYGVNQDLVDLFDEAKRLGIRILLDLVPNHTSDEHEWFQKSVANDTKYRDYYTWKDCEAEERFDAEKNQTVWVVTRPPNNWIAVFHTIAWSYRPERGQCYLHQFLAGQPDLNYRNPAVKDDMFEVLKFWMDRGADGFRIDAINHMFEVEDFADEAYIDPNGDKTFYDNLYHNHTRDLDESYQVVFEWRRKMDEYAAANNMDRKFLMTEAYAEYDLQIKWYGTNETPGSHMPFNFALISNLDRDSNAQDFQEAVHAWYSRLPQGFGAEANWVLGNHDRPRIGYRYGDERHESLAMMTMLLPGINVVYYGEEILMTDNRAITWEETDDPAACQTNETVYQLYTRDPVRTPFQWDNTQHAGFSRAARTWLPVHTNYTITNLKAQTEAEKSTFKFYQHIIQLRKENIFRNGAFRSQAMNPTVFAYVRTLEGENPVCVFINLGRRAILNVHSILRIGEFPPNARGRILAATSTSNYNIDDIISVDQFELRDYDAIAVVIEESPSTSTQPTTAVTETTPASASNVVATLMVMMMSVLVILL